MIKTIFIVTTICHVWSRIFTCLLYVLVLFRYLCYLPFARLCAHTVTVKTQHYHIEVSCQCVHVCIYMYRRPDGVNNEKTRISSMKELHNNTVYTNDAMGYIRTYTVTDWNIEKPHYHQSSNVRFFFIFCRIRLANMNFQFQYRKLLIPSEAIHQVQAIGLVCST